MLNDTEEKFIQELKLLLRKYNVRIEQHHVYDGHDEVVGDYFNFIGDNIEIIDISECEPLNIKLV